MGLIYKINSRNGGERQSSYHNECLDDGGVIRKVKEHSFKDFDGLEAPHRD